MSAQTLSHMFSLPVGPGTQYSSNSFSGKPFESWCTCSASEPWDKALQLEGKSREGYRYCSIWDINLSTEQPEEAHTSQLKHPSQSNIPEEVLHPPVPESVFTSSPPGPVPCVHVPQPHCSVPVLPAAPALPPHSRAGGQGHTKGLRTAAQGRHPFCIPPERQRKGKDFPHNSLQMECKSRKRDSGNILPRGKESSKPHLTLKTRSSSSWVKEPGEDPGTPGERGIRRHPCYDCILLAPPEL